MAIIWPVFVALSAVEASLAAVLWQLLRESESRLQRLAGLLSIHCAVTFSAYLFWEVLRQMRFCVAWQEFAETAWVGLLGAAVICGLFLLRLPEWDMGVDELLLEVLPPPEPLDRGLYQRTLLDEAYAARERIEEDEARELQHKRNAGRKTKRRVFGGRRMPDEANPLLPRKEDWLMETPPAVSPLVRRKGRNILSAEEVVLWGLSVPAPSFLTPAEIVETPGIRVVPSVRDANVWGIGEEEDEDRAGVIWEEWFKSSGHGVDLGILPIRDAAWWLRREGASGLEEGTVLHCYNGLDPKETGPLPIDELNCHDSMLYMRCVSVTRPAQIPYAIYLIKAAVDINPHYRTQWLRTETTRNQFRDSIAVSCEFATYPAEFMEGWRGSFYNDAGLPIYDPKDDQYIQKDFDRNLLSVLTVAVDRVLVVNFHVLHMLKHPSRPGYIAERQTVDEVARIFSELIFDVNYYKFWYNLQRDIAAVDATIEHMYRPPEGRREFADDGVARRPKYKGALKDDSGIFVGRPKWASFHPPGKSKAWRGSSCPYGFHEPGLDLWGRPCPCRSNNIDLSCFIDYILRDLGHTPPEAVTNARRPWYETRYTRGYRAFLASMLWQDPSVGLLRGLNDTRCGGKIGFPSSDHVCSQLPQGGECQRNCEEWESYRSYEKSVSEFYSQFSDPGFEADGGMLGYTVSSVVGIALVVKFLTTTESPRLLAERLFLYGQLGRGSNMDQEFMLRNPSRPLPSVQPPSRRLAAGHLGDGVSLFTDNEPNSPSDLLDWRFDTHIYNAFGAGPPKAGRARTDMLSRRRIFSFMLKEPSFGQYVIRLRYPEALHHEPIDPDLLQLVRMLEQVFKHVDKRRYMVEGTIAHLQLRLFDSKVARLSQEGIVVLEHIFKPGQGLETKPRWNILSQPLRRYPEQTIQELAEETVDVFETLDSILKAQRGELSSRDTLKRGRSLPGSESFDLGTPLRGAVKRRRANNITYSQLEDYLSQYWTFRLALREPQNPTGISRSITHDLMFNPVLYHMLDLRVRRQEAAGAQREFLLSAPDGGPDSPAMDISWSFERPREVLAMADSEVGLGNRFEPETGGEVDSADEDWGQMLPVDWDVTIPMLQARYSRIGDQSAGEQSLADTQKPLGSLQGLDSEVRSFHAAQEIRTPEGLEPQSPPTPKAPSLEDQSSASTPSQSRDLQEDSETQASSLTSQGQHETHQAEAQETLAGQSAAVQQTHSNLPTPRPANATQTISEGNPRATPSTDNPHPTPAHLQNMQLEENLKARESLFLDEEYSIDGKTLECTVEKCGVTGEMACGKFGQSSHLRARWESLFPVQPIRDGDDWVVRVGVLRELMH